MKVSDYILTRLADAGITHGFGVYGGAIGPLFDAFTRQSRMQYIVTMHEQAAGFCAEGWAKAKGLPGFAFATSGPGGGNLVVPIQNCYYDSVPCIFITGQVQTAFMRTYHSPMRQVGFQETPIAEITHPITKWSVCLTDPDMVKSVMDKALKKCMGKRPGPVLIDIPIDVQRCSLTI